MRTLLASSEALRVIRMLHNAILVLVSSYEQIGLLRVTMLFFRASPKQGQLIIDSQLEVPSQHTPSNNISILPYSPNYTASPYSNISSQRPPVVRLESIAKAHELEYEAFRVLSSIAHSA
ncbi:hypothetical protein Fot_42591 [Forsythia ovata]|uniref:Uncharacterized protein n=1 Tax=Forsythia ovata TaxID=205694 RepID=A0ABD1RMK9_9LAMI